MSGPSALAGLSRSEPSRSAPSVPEPPARRGSRVILPGVLLILFVGVVLFAARDALRSRLEVTIVPVVVRAGGTVSAGTVVATAAGWIEPDPYPVHVSTLTNGVIAEMLVLEGERVEAGQVVARLVPDDARLAADRAEAGVMLAEAALRNAAADLQAAQTDSDNPVELERHASVAAAKLDEARAERVRLDRDREVIEARIAELRDEHERAERAVETGAVSASGAAQLRLQIATQTATHAALVAREAILDARVREAESEHRAAQRDLELRVELRRGLDATRARHERANAELADARVRRQEAQLRLERMNVRAPVAGVVMRRLAEPGHRLMLDMDMEGASWAVDIYDPEHLQVRVDVPLADAGGVGVGQTARVRVETLPDRTFPAEVSRLVHYADIQKNTVEVKVRLLETAPELKPEMLARVEILGAVTTTTAPTTDRSRVFAPERLVAGGVAWVVGPGGDTATRHAVTRGRTRSGDWIEITSGLSPGDRLIDVDPATLSEGAAIDVVGESAK